jgi:hypothetical protein
MIDKQTLNRLATEAGFGANQRTTLLVKLTKFAELVQRHTTSLPASRHGPQACSAAFEWLRAEATKDGASEHAGVALDEWSALSKTCARPARED